MRTRHPRCPHRAPDGGPCLLTPFHLGLCDWGRPLAFGDEIEVAFPAAKHIDCQWFRGVVVTIELGVPGRVRVQFGSHASHWVESDQWRLPEPPAVTAGSMQIRPTEKGEGVDPREDYPGFYEPPPVTRWPR